MQRSEDTVKVSLAWTRALRAAALLLNREVCRHVLACRADLPATQRVTLEEVSVSAWMEAASLYDPDVWQYFEIDEREVVRRAVGLAQLRMSGRLEEAANAQREALRRVLTAA